LQKKIAIAGRRNVQLVLSFDNAIMTHKHAKEKKEKEKKKKKKGNEMN
jgi:hypothetical protein